MPQIVAAIAGIGYAIAAISPSLPPIDAFRRITARRRRALRLDTLRYSDAPADVTLPFRQRCFSRASEGRQADTLRLASRLLLLAPKIADAD